MIFKGASVHFWLSPGGQKALSSIMSKAADFEALVVEEDEIGLWIWIPDGKHQQREVTLLKWDCFASARLEYWPDVEQEKAPAGFRRPL